LHLSFELEVRNGTNHTIKIKVNEPSYSTDAVYVLEEFSELCLVPTLAEPKVAPWWGVTRLARLLRDGPVDDLYFPWAPFVSNIRGG